MCLSVVNADILRQGRMTVPHYGLRDIQSRTHHVRRFLRRFLTAAASVILQAAATTTTSDIIFVYIAIMAI